jgi:hypothetical protein
LGLCVCHTRAPTPLGSRRIPDDGKQAASESISDRMGRERAETFSQRSWYKPDKWQSRQKLSIHFDCFKQLAMPPCKAKVLLLALLLFSTLILLRTWSTRVLTCRKDEHLPRKPCPDGHPNCHREYGSWYRSACKYPHFLAYLISTNSLL